MKNGVIVTLVLVLVVLGVLAYNLNSKGEMPMGQGDNFVLNDSNFTAHSSNTGTESAASANTPALSGNPEIHISNFKYSPAEIKITAGSSITWINDDSAPHTVTSDSGKEVNSGEMLQGKRYNHIFTEKGTYNYHCEYHSGMKGKIVVE